MLKKRIIIVIVVVVVLVILLIFLLNKTLNKNIKIIFNSELETKSFLLNDKDNYIKNMSNADLIARHISSNENYLLNIVNSALSFSTVEKQQLIQIMKVVSKMFIKLGFVVNFSVKFSKVGKIYESGYPHTRYNIIFLSPIFFANDAANSIKILKHECIHIYQRYNPTITEKYLNINGFKKIGNFKSLYPKEYILKRSNSDIDDNIWQNKNGQLMFPIFSSNNPQSLSDLWGDKKMEHPYEWMAYNLENF